MAHKIVANIFQNFNNAIVCSRGWTAYRNVLLAFCMCDNSKCHMFGSLLN